ncbi:hypothetical protein GE09DRAFT_1227616 [Coniochaeta sp. 2T2.1]|nr:hypothetical protein GE09DRAFT_1227616 [Coniochaeta sp. 2T2.1]
MMSPAAKANLVVCVSAKIDDSVSTKPAIEMYYGVDGTITVGIQRSRSGGGQAMTTLGRVPVRQRFQYEIRWEKGTTGSASTATCGSGEVVSPSMTYTPIPTSTVPVLVPGGAQSGIGQYNLMAVLAHTGGGRGGSGGGSCKDALVAAVGSETTTTLKLFSPTPTVARPLSKPSRRDCKGSAVDYKLINQAGCQAAGGGGEYRSSTVAASGNSGGGSGGGTASPGSCSNKPAQPSNSGDNTLTLSLHASSCCTDTAFATTTIGKLGVCHKAKKGFRGVTECVGTNPFGRDLHVWAFKDHACGGSSPMVIDLTNDAECYTSTDSQTYFSFAVVQGLRGDRSTFTSCKPSPAAVKTDNTVTLKLFSDDCCTETQTFSLGTLGTCHTPSAGSFTGLMQATGENMFGRGVKIWAYPDSTSCAGDKRVDIAVSGNEEQCYWLGSGSSRVALGSLKIDTGSLGSGDGGGGGDDTYGRQPT